MSESMLRIGFDASCLLTRPMTGVGYYTWHLLEALCTQNACRLSLFAATARPEAGDLDGLEQRAYAVTIKRWPTRLKLAMWTRFGVPALERFTGPVDIAHGGFHLLPPSKNAKRVVTVFDLTSLHHPDTHTGTNVRMHTRLLRHAVSQADGIIAISESCKRDVIDLLGANPQQMYVVPGGVSLEAFEAPLENGFLAQTKQSFKIDRPWFIHLGTLEPRKNLPRLLEAYALVKDTLADCPLLVLAGQRGWKYEAVLEAIANLGLEQDVIQTGYVTRAEAVALLRGAVACLYPSLYEGFGLPVLEAMAAGTPVLTSNVSSLPEVAGDTGIQVPPDNVAAIAAGMIQLLDDAAGNEVRVAAARERARQFSWAASASKLMQAYQAIHQGGGRGE